jgi:hypothetical protein
MEGLIARTQRLLVVGLTVLLALSIGCEPGPSATELGLRATVESLRDELSRLQTTTPQVMAADATPSVAQTVTAGASGTPAVNPVSASVPDSRLLDWRPVNQRVAVGDLELQVHALLLGQDMYGSVYGSTITAGPGRKIILADMALKYEFRPGASPYEVHVDYFVISDTNGLEYRGLPVPGVGNALSDRIFVSSGQMYRGIVAFIVPRELESGLIYFTNFLGGKDPPDRLMVNLATIPVSSSASVEAKSPVAVTPTPATQSVTGSMSRVSTTQQTARLRLLEPFASMGTIDGLLTIRWQMQARDPTQQGTVTLLYSPENISGRGTRIADVPASTGQYRWDTTAVPQGTYWIVAQWKDGSSSEQQFSSTPFTVFRAFPESATGSGAPLRTLLDERFANNQRGWRSDRSGTAWLAEDGYHVYNRDPGRFVALRIPQTESTRDVAVTVSFRKLEAGPGAGFGVIVRDQGPAPRDGFNQVGRFFTLKINDRSDLDAWRRDDDRWADLLPLTQSGAIRQGRELNHLSVLAVGERLSLVINGIEAASIPDPAPVAGNIGLFLNGDYAHVLVERVVVQQLQ